MRRLISVLLLILPVMAHADLVYLTNGDRISGTVQSLDNEKLVIKTEYAGDVRVAWDNVSGITADTPLILIRNSDSRLEVQNLLRNDDALVVTYQGEDMKVRLDEVRDLRNTDRQRLYDISQHPEWRRYWSATGALGFALASGNSDTRNLNFTMDSSRKTLHDKTSIYASTVYSTDAHAGRLTANATRGGIRYDHDIRERLFGFGSSYFEYDDLQSLNLRSTLGGGLGWHVTNNTRKSLDLLGGFAYTREGYDNGITQNFSTGTLAVEHRRQLTNLTAINQRAEFDTYLNDPGNFHGSYAATVSTRINRLLSWQSKISNIYFQTPLPGKQRNDFLLTTGVGLTFSSIPK